MGLSHELISQFAKVVNDNKKQSGESTVYGKVVTDGNGNKYVKLDGTDQLTPLTDENRPSVDSSTANAKEGDRVSVLIKNHTATVTGNVSSPAVRNDDFNDLNDQVTDIKEFDIVIADKVQANEGYIKNLQADKLSVGDFNAAKADIEELIATKASIEELNAAKAEITDLKTTKLDAEVADIKFATIENLEATTAKVGTLEADVGHINTLMFGTASGSVLQTEFANAVIALLGDAQIKSAMIEGLDASKINAGTINTANVKIESEDGHMVISDNTIQISDDNRVRVQIGKDASDDYSITVIDANGNVMFSEGGITKDAIKNPIIRNDMVADDANINAKKIDISSLFTEINDSTETIKSTKIYMDSSSQTLDIAFNEMATTVTEQGETIVSQGTNISTIQGQIESKIWQQDIDTSTSEMNTKYSNLEQDLNGFKSTVSETYSTKNELENISSSIIENADSISASVSSIEERVNNNSEDIMYLQEKANVQLTKEDVEIQINTAVQNGVNRVETTTGFIFDEDGLNINKTDSPTNTQITENGMTVYNNYTGGEMLKANKDGVDAANLKASTYLIIGGRSRFENYEKDGSIRTGCFWVGG